MVSGGGSRETLGPQRDGSLGRVSESRFEGAPRDSVLCLCGLECQLRWDDPISDSWGTGCRGKVGATRVEGGVVTRRGRTIG